MGSFAGTSASNDGFLLPGRYLGWAPAVTSPGAGAGPGGAVAPGYPVGGSALSIDQILASAPDGHLGPDQTATLDAGLTLNVPTSARNGDYTGTLTLTALS